MLSSIVKESEERGRIARTIGDIKLKELEERLRLPNGPASSLTASYKSAMVTPTQ
jgi:hypothetical protein